MKTNFFIRKLFRDQAFLLLVLLVIMIFVFSALSPNFANANNFSLILSQTFCNLIGVLGLATVFISGHIDISTGAVMCMCAGTAAKLAKADMPVVVWLLLPILMGAAAGAINGTLTRKLNFHPIICTTATNYVFRGLCYVICGVQYLVDFPKSFTTWSITRVAGMPIPFIIFLFMLLGFWFFLTRTGLGRRIYVIGNDKASAERMGIHVDKTAIIAYTICGAVMGFAGVVNAASTGTVNPATTGAATGTQLMAAALAGGVSIGGGKGSVIGAVIGAFFVGIIRNGLIICRISEYWIDAVTGAIILAALLLNGYTLKQELKARKELK